MEILLENGTLGSNLNGELDQIELCLLWRHFGYLC